MLNDIQINQSRKFNNFCRMLSSNFEYLLNKIGPFISKKDTNMRKCIPVQERLAVTLRYLATGDSFISLSYLFKFSPQSISQCVQEVCAAIGVRTGVAYRAIATPETSFLGRYLVLR